MKNESFLKVSVMWAKSKWSVAHVIVKKIRMVMARRSNGGEARVEEEILRDGGGGFGF